MFDCSTRKSLEACNETLKQIAIYVGKEYGKQADLIKFVVENEKDPEIDKPADISTSDQNNKLKMFMWQEQAKRYMDRKEGLELGKKKLYTLIWGQCTKAMQNELETSDKFEKMKEDQDPIVLIQEIKSITYSFRDQKYVIGSMWRAFKTFSTLHNVKKKI